MDEHEFVPEVDAASLAHVQMPATTPPSGPQPDSADTESAKDTTQPEVQHQTSPTTDTDPAKASNIDPAEAIKSLPPDLAAHIQEMVAEAEAQGYLRGRNELIEATQHFDVDDDLDERHVQFPTYSHRSIWEM